ncbi:MAG: hypothetical protein R3E87_18155 [Burkholderiaceae bacterium]
MNTAITPSVRRSAGARRSTRAEIKASNEGGTAVVAELSARISGDAAAAVRCPHERSISSMNSALPVVDAKTLSRTEYNAGFRPISESIIASHSVGPSGSSLISATCCVRGRDGLSRVVMITAKPATG